MGDQIKADYEALQQIAKQFNDLGDRTKDVRGKVLTAYQDVEGQWVGKGSKKFKEQMDGTTLTTIINLQNSMYSISQSIGAIAQKFHDAEDAVKSKGASVTGGGSADPWAGGGSTNP